METFISFQKSKKYREAAESLKEGLCFTVPEFDKRVFLSRQVFFYPGVNQVEVHLGGGSAS